MIGGVELGGAATYKEKALSSDINLFIQAEHAPDIYRSAASRIFTAFSDAPSHA